MQWLSQATPEINCSKAHLELPFGFILFCLSHDLVILQCFEVYTNMNEPGSSGSIVSDYGLDERRSRFDPRQGQRIFPLASVSRPALRPTQPPVQWVPGVLSPGVKRGRGVTLTTQPHLVPRS
jgi:hypothetical protein